MADYTLLKAAIQQVIKTNGNQEITGLLLQQTLLSLIDDLNLTKQDKINFVTNAVTRFLREDGTFQEIPTPTGSFTNNVYLSETPSDVGAYKVLNYVPDSSETVKANTISAADGNKLVGTYLYPVGLSTNLVPAGPWSFIFNTFISSAVANTNIGVQCFVRNLAGVETNLFTVWSDDINSSSRTEIKINFSGQVYTVNDTDRMGVRIFLRTTSVPTATVSFIVGSNYSSYFNTPVAIRHKQIRALNEDSNYQHITSTEKTNFQAAYTDRFKWDGGSSGLNASNARESLGLRIGIDILAYDGTAADSNKLGGYAASEYQKTIAAGTTLDYYRGDKTWQVLNTSVVPELTNLYFTDARSRSTVIDTLTLTNAAILSTDSFQTAFGKAQAQINNRAMLNGSLVQDFSVKSLNLDTTILYKADADFLKTLQSLFYYDSANDSIRALKNFYSVSGVSAFGIGSGGGGGGGVVVIDNLTSTLTNAALSANQGRILKGYIDLKQPQLNGTGLVRMSGTGVTYDNTSYATVSQLSGYALLAGSSSQDFFTNNLTVNKADSDSVYMGSSVWLGQTYIGLRAGIDKSFNIDTYNSGSSLNALKILQTGLTTITSTHYNPLRINNISATPQSAIEVQLSGITKAYIGYHGVIGAFLQNGISPYGTLGILDDTTPYYSANGGSTRHILLHAGNYSSYALPLSGGTLSGSLLFSGYQDIAWNGGWGNGGTAIVGSANGLVIYPKGNIGGGVVTIAGQGDVIHSGNIGSQSVNYATSAGNADTLDTYHATSFLRKNEVYYMDKYVLESIPKNTTQVGSFGWVDYTTTPYAGGGFLTLNMASSLRSLLMIFPDYSNNANIKVLTSIDGAPWGQQKEIAWKDHNHDGTYIQNQIASAQSASLWTTGTIRTNGTIQFGVSSTMFLGIGGNITTGLSATDLLLFNTGGDAYLWATGGVGLKVAATTGNVGIRTATPNASLHIGSGTGGLHYNGGSDGTMLIHGVGGNRSQLELLSPDSSMRLILQAVQGYAHNMSFTNGHLFLDLTSGYNMSIGFGADQGYKLAVNGSGYFNGSLTNVGHHYINGVGNYLWFDTLGAASSIYIGTVNNYDLRLSNSRGNSCIVDLLSEGVVNITGGVAASKYIETATYLKVGTSIKIGANWEAIPNGNDLDLKFGGVLKARLDSSGNILAVGGVTAFAI